MDEEKQEPEQEWMANEAAAYQRAERYLNSLIFGPPSPPPGTSQEEIRARAVARLARLRAFLAFLGNPQRAYRTIHVTGTSGKGSTTTITASILTAAGYRVGAHVSPYLQVATEKLQIDGRLISAGRYERLVDDMHRSVDEWVAAGRERPNYGEIWVAMTLRYFAEEQVDVAVVEVGAGGRFDVTNVLEPDVVAITSVGLDHTVTLGSTLEEIAWHKAGIIKPGSVAVTAVTGPETLPIIEEECRQTGADLVVVREGERYRDVRADADGTSFIDGATDEAMRITLPGTFQASNAAMAIEIARRFTHGHLPVETLRAGLAAARFPGRMELVQDNPRVLLDGAHNPEKVASLARNLEHLYPHQRKLIIFGALESKSHASMLASLSPLAGLVIATMPRVLAKPATDAAEIAAEVIGDVEVIIEPSPERAIEIALARAEPDDLVVVTGSLYLVGNIRERWYPSEAILSQSNCWPRTTPLGLWDPPLLAKET
ncbi:MAG: folylpolyglutamate synthase/dihydrofolate synthase family protein [Thermomicrobiales bacterium]